MEYKLILKQNNYFSHCGTDPVKNAIQQNDKWNQNNLPTEFHYWDNDLKDFVLNESLKVKVESESLLADVYAKQDTLRDKMLKNDYKYRIKSPETYEQYKTEYDEEMKVLILQEQELKTAIDGK